MADEAYTGIPMLEVLAQAENYNGYLAALIKEQMRPNDRVVDFGAGLGTFAALLKQTGADVTCVEPDARLKARLEQAGFCTTATADEIPDQSVDYIYTLNVLEHIEDDRGVARTLARKLKPGGRILVYVPAFQVLYSAHDKRYGHLRRYRRPDLVRLLVDAGLQVTRAEYVDSLGYLAALMYRIVGDPKGEVSASAIMVFDTFVFPLSRVLDRVLRHVAGKNVVVLAEKPHQGQRQR
jgi:SAM-dependent methyltransferase